MLLAAGVIGGLMSVLPRHLPGFVVVLIVYIPLLLITTYMLRLHKSAPLSKGWDVIPLWLLISGLEASAVMLIYSRLLDQRQDGEATFWLLLGLGLPVAIIAILWPFYLADKRKGED